MGYIRASTSGRQELGLKAQRKALKRWCRAHQVDLVVVFEDEGVSGAAELDSRPGLLAALDAVREHGAGVLLVAKRDRLARDVVVSGMVERLAERDGARVVAADGTGNGSGPEAQLMRGIVDLFAQYERQLIKSRIKAALSIKKARGERVGGIPYGFVLGADGSTLEPDYAERRVVARVRELRGSGLTWTAVARQLDGDDMKPRGGKRWHPFTVSRMAERTFEDAA